MKKIYEREDSGVERRDFPDERKGIFTNPFNVGPEFKRSQ